MYNFAWVTESVIKTDTITHDLVRPDHHVTHIAPHEMHLHPALTGSTPSIPTLAAAGPRPRYRPASPPGGLKANRTCI